MTIDRYSPRRPTVWLLAAACTLVLPERAAAQAPTGPTRTAVAGPQYRADGMERVLFGDNWRVLWTTPVRVPVLDLGTYAGGLEPFEEGGRQSRTLHFRNPEGRRFIFRSVDKYLHREGLPPAVRHTPMGNVIQDAISVLLPGVGLVMAPLHEAAGVLHSRSEFVVMPDDARLGEWRETFAGMLGQIEENPDELPDDEPGFAGSEKVVKTASMLERLDESPEHRLHSREYLALRLVDFLVNDTDRGGDQWKFASFPDGDRQLWRPVSRDHDFALMRADGLFGWLAQRGYPKLTSLKEGYPPLTTLTFMTRDMDRRFLVDVPRAAWDSVATTLQARLTDHVLAAAIGRLPAEYQEHAADDLLAVLKMRRDRLHEVASEFYAMVAREADIFATDEPERAEIERAPDGSVVVRITEIDGGGIPLFERRFVPSETREVRLFMRGGGDHVTVHGAPTGPIEIRVISGEGRDTLVDSGARGQGTMFYAEDEDALTLVPGTGLDRRPFAHTAPGRPEDLWGLCCGLEPGDEEAGGAAADEDVERRLAGERYRDWGASSSFRPVLEHRSGPGILVGAGHNRTRYGFRHVPHAYSVDLRALYAVESGRFGADLRAEYRPENSPYGLEAIARAAQFESFRFFGYGNDTPADAAGTRVYREEVTLRPALFWESAAARVSAGPVLRYGQPDYDQESPLARDLPPGTEAFGQVGASVRARLDLGRLDPVEPRGARFEAGGGAYPALWDVSNAFGNLEAVASAYLGLPGPGSPFLAVRAGGEKVWGGFPVHEAAFIGGRHSLRGHATDRFAGDASLYGSGELHVALATVELLVRGRLGAFALVDAGRVYVDGASPDGWHSALGGGLRFASMGRALSLTWAAGERERLYLGMGLPF